VSLLITLTFSTVLAFLDTQTRVIIKGLWFDAGFENRGDVESSQWMLLWPR